MNAPAAPTATFAALGVPEQLTRALHERGIDAPFPIQEATLPDSLAGRDVCGRAPTGSGKTLAFGIPLAVRVTHAAPKRPKALVLVPTRELAAQVRDELVALVKPFGRTVHAFYGGVGFGPQVSALRKGVDIVVACPGRLADLINRGDVRLDRVTTVVLDEADRMADMGFLPEVKRLLDQVHPERQTLLFSATLDGDVDVLIRRYQNDPVRHGVDREEDAPVHRHALWTAERGDKVAITADVVSKHWPAVVFSRTKHGADRIARQLAKLGVDAVAIHGNRSQSQRERALKDFTSHRAQALVATDVAARGIHVDGVACVVHFDAPPDHKDFVHRSGRTGRAGAEGLVVTLAPAADIRDVTKMMRKAGIEVEATRPDVAALGDAPVAVTRQPRPAENEGRSSRGEGGRSGGSGGSGGSGRDGSRSGGARRRGRNGSGRPEESRDRDGTRHEGDRTPREGRSGDARTEGRRSDGRPGEDRGRSSRDGARSSSGRPGGSRSGGGRSSGSGQGGSGSGRRSERSGERSNERLDLSGQPRRRGGRPGGGRPGSGSSSGRPGAGAGSRSGGGGGGRSGGTGGRSGGSSGGGGRSGSRRPR